jgi:hypothetical protein
MSFFVAYVPVLILYSVHKVVFVVLSFPKFTGFAENLCALRGISYLFIFNAYSNNSFLIFCSNM